MDTKQLLVKAEEKLKGALADFENDKKQLETLKKERGDLVANELIESQPKRAETVKKLEKMIANLRNIIEDTPAVIEGLKKARFSLKSKVEEETTEKTRKEQTKIEISLNETSSKLVKLLKEVQVQNSKLKDEWASFDKLNLVSGKGLTEKRCVRPSEGMIDLVVQTLLNEWGGVSSAEIRQFYSKRHYKTHCVEF